MRQSTLSSGSTERWATRSGANVQARSGADGGDLYELAKILGHSIKMTERYAKLVRQHIARTSGTARELWKILEPQCTNAANVG